MSIKHLLFSLAGMAICSATALAGTFHFEHNIYKGFGERPMHLVIDGIEAYLYTEGTGAGGEIGLYHTQIKPIDCANLENLMPEKGPTDEVFTPQESHEEFLLKTETKNISVQLTNNATFLYAVREFAGRVDGIESKLRNHPVRTMRMELLKPAEGLATDSLSLFMVKIKSLGAGAMKVDNKSKIWVEALYKGDEYGSWKRYYRSLGADSLVGNIIKAGEELTVTIPVTFDKLKAGAYRIRAFYRNRRLGEPANDEQIYGETYTEEIPVTVAKRSSKF